MNFFVCAFKKNIKMFKQEANMVNRSVGFVKEIIHAKNETPASSLLMYFIVDFGDANTGKFFSSDPEKYGWIPIKPIITK